MELSLAAKRRPGLAQIIAEQERAIGHTMTEAASDIFAEEVVSSAGFQARWATALGAARGIAALRLLGHPAEAVDRQWAAARRLLLGLLLDGAQAAHRN